MPIDEILDRIRNQTDVDTDEQARAILEATLETLGERLSYEESTDIADFLPEDIATEVVDWDSESESSFGIDEFLDRVADRSGASDRGQAQQWAQATMEAMENEAIGRELRRARQPLPDEYDTLFSDA